MYDFSCVTNSLYREIYLSCTILRKRSELNAYCCTPKAFIYKILNREGLCSPANSFSCKEVTLCNYLMVLINFSNVSALYIPYISMVLSNFNTLLCWNSASLFMAIIAFCKASLCFFLKKARNHFIC